MGIARTLFYFLDFAVYWAVGVLFQLIIDLSKFNLFSASVIKDFANRIYVILGIIMIFKLMISFIQMLIDPDRMNDKENGVGGILKRVIISMVLIVMVGSIFDFAMDLQEKLLPIIPKVILGAEAEIAEGSEIVATTGTQMAYYTFTAFFYPYDGACWSQTNLMGFGNPDATINTVTGIGLSNVNEKCADGDDGYTHRYVFLLPTLAGAFLVWTLVTIAVKVAIRAVKLSLCRIIAPIPIASYIDPKTSKQSFDKWVETTIKTYIDLFVNLVSVYFVIYIFQLLFVRPDTAGLTIFQSLPGKYGNSYARAALVVVFIITGLLHFAKEMPKFVTSMLGIPEGMGDLGDILRGQGFRQLRDAGQLVTNPLTVGGGNWLNAWRQNANRPLLDRLRRTAGSAIGGGVSAAARSTTAILGGQEVAEAARRGREGAILARRNRGMDRADDVHWHDRARVGMQTYFGIDDDVSSLQPQVEATNKVSSALSGFTSAVSGRMDKHENLSFRSGESQVLDSIARAIERNGGVWNLAHSDNVAAQRLAGLFEVGEHGEILTFDEAGNVTHDGTGHVRFAREQGITNRELQEYAEALQGTALGGFFASNGLKQDAIREIRNNVAAHEAVDLVRDIQGRVIDVVASGLNEHRDIDSARNAVYQAQRENATNLINVDTNRVDENGQAIIINGNQAHQEEFNRNFSDYSDMIQDHRNALQERVNDNPRNASDEAARRSQQRRQQNNQQNGGNGH